MPSHSLYASKCVLSTLYIGGRAGDPCDSMADTKSLMFYKKIVKMFFCFFYVFDENLLKVNTYCIARHDGLRRQGVGVERAFFVGSARPTSFCVGG